MADKVNITLQNLYIFPIYVIHIHRYIQIYIHRICSSSLHYGPCLLNITIIVGENPHILASKEERMPVKKKKKVYREINAKEV